MLGWFNPDAEFFEFFSDKWELLPDGSTIQQCDILNYKTEEFYFYYEVWENYHYFGLPHGKGSAYEKPWVIQIIKTFQKCFDLYQYKQIKK